MKRKYVYQDNDNIDLKNRTIYLNEEISQASLGLVLKALDQLEHINKKPVEIIINSSGGDLFESLGIVDRIITSPLKIKTKVYGNAMSGAASIFIAGDERFMSRYSWLMLHQLTDEFDGNVDNMKVILKLNLEIEQQIYNFYETMSGTPAHKFKEMCSQDCYLNAGEALKLGLTHHIIGAIEWKD